MLSLIPFILGCIAFAGGLVGAGRWLAHIHAPRPLEPERCLICELPVDTDASGEYRCQHCGFDAGRAREAAYKALVEGLRDLREVRHSLARVRDWYRDVDHWRDEMFDLPRPAVANAPLLRDLVRDAPHLLKCTSPFRATEEQAAVVVSDLLCVLAGVPTGSEDRFDWDDADFETRRREALRRIEAWERTLMTFHRLLGERLEEAMGRPHTRVREGG